MESERRRAELTTGLPMLFKGNDFTKPDIEAIIEWRGIFELSEASFQCQYRTGYEARA